MPLNPSGQISLAGSTVGQSIALELGRTATTTTSLGETAVRNLCGVPSGAISLSNAYGKSVGPAVLNVTYTTNQADLLLNVSTISGYSAGNSQITINVSSGVYIYATSISATAFTISGANTGDTITLVNDGFILGKGGNGGSPPHVGGTGAGQNGGKAMEISYPMTINALNFSALIGGGGGGGASTVTTPTGTVFALGGGGGGCGGGNGGNGYGAPRPSNPVPTQAGISGSGGAGASVGGTGSAGTPSGVAGSGGGPGGGGGGAVGTTPSKGGSRYQGAGGGGGTFRFQPGGGRPPGGVGPALNGGAGGDSNFPTPGVAGQANPGSSYGAGGGGGGWGASGGPGSSNSGTAGTGGQAIKTNGASVTFVSGYSGRIYGAVSP